MAFGSNYTLCLFRKYFRDEPIVSASWAFLNVTVFSASNASEEIPVTSMEEALYYASGYVVGERFTSVSGFLLNDRFYGTIYMTDSLHYLEPHGRESKVPGQHESSNFLKPLAFQDLKIFGNGLETLLHK